MHWLLWLSAIVGSPTRECIDLREMTCAIEGIVNGMELASQHGGSFFVVYFLKKVVNFIKDGNSVECNNTAMRIIWEIDNLRLLDESVLFNLLELPQNHLSICFNLIEILLKIKILNSRTIVFFAGCGPTIFAEILEALQGKSFFNAEAFFAVFCNKRYLENPDDLEFFKAIRRLKLKVLLTTEHIESLYKVWMAAPDNPQAIAALCEEIIRTRALNGTQKNIIKGFLNFYFEDIASAKLEPELKIKALQMIRDNNPDKTQIELFETVNIWDSIQGAKAVLEHPCPQNPTQNYQGWELDNLQESRLLDIQGHLVALNPINENIPINVQGIDMLVMANAITLRSPDGVCRVLAADEIFYKNEKGELVFGQRGLLNLTVRNDGTTAPVNRDSVVFYVMTLIDEQIEKFQLMINLVEDVGAVAVNENPNLHFSFDENAAPNPMSVLADPLASVEPFAIDEQSPEPSAVGCIGRLKKSKNNRSRGCSLQ